MSGHDLGGLAPENDREKVGRIVAVGVLAAAVAGDVEIQYSGSAGGVAQFGGVDDTTLYGDSVQHKFFSSRYLAGFMEAMDSMT